MYQGLHVDELTSRHETMLRKRKKSLNKCSDDKSRYQAIEGFVICP